MTQMTHLLELHHRCLEGRMRRERARLWLQFMFAAFVTIGGLLIVSAAKADEHTIRFGTEGYAISGPNGATVVTPLPDAGPRIINVQPGQIPAWTTAHRARWWLRCRPRLRMDDLGVQRFIYAKAGCEFGADREPNFERELEPAEDK